MWTVTLNNKIWFVKYSYGFVILMDCGLAFYLCVCGYNSIIRWDRGIVLLLWHSVVSWGMTWSNPILYPHCIPRHHPQSNMLPNTASIAVWNRSSDTLLYYYTVAQDKVILPSYDPPSSSAPSNSQVMQWYLAFPRNEVLWMAVEWHRFTMRSI